MKRKRVSVWRFGMEKRAKDAAKQVRKDGWDVEVAGKLLYFIGAAPAEDVAKGYVKSLGLLGCEPEPKGWEKLL